MSMITPQRATKRSSHLAGFALLEVLISFVVLAFGMLGIAGLLLTSHKANASSYIRQQAIQSMSNIADRIRANSATAVAGLYKTPNLSAYTIPATPSVNCDVSACSPAQLATYDVYYWLVNDLAVLLPEGRGAISTTPNGTNTKVTITVQWNDAPAQKKFDSSPAAPGAPQNPSQMSIETLL